MPKVNSGICIGVLLKLENTYKRLLASDNTLTPKEAIKMVASDFCPDTKQDRLYNIWKIQVIKLKKQLGIETAVGRGRACKVKREALTEKNK